MKNRMWLLQLPAVIFFTFAFWITEAGVQGDLNNAFLREKLFPGLRRYSGLITDWKFHFRGPEQPKNKIVIVEVDSPSLERIGRWPWHRDVTAYLVDKTFQAGAKVVGLDMVFSEPDRRVSEELSKLLQEKRLGNRIREFETDYVLGEVIQKYSDKLVLGWTSEGVCQPAYLTSEECPLTNPDALATHPKNFDKFTFSLFSTPAGFDMTKTPLMSIATFIANLPEYNDVARHMGSFNVFPDPDSIIRRANLVFMADGKPYPSLPLEMARVGLNERLDLQLDQRQRIAYMKFANSGRNIPVSPLGVMEVNFRGPGRTFQYVSALDILSDEDQIQIEANRAIASVSKKELLKDAYVLIGISALGVFDMRAFPFDSIVPGVEGHAFILDNLLSDDPIRPATGATSVCIFLLMTVGAIFFAYLAQRLESIPALLLFIFTFSGVAAFDQKVLFANNINWNTGFFYAEIAFIFALTIAIKYVLEERNKKFIRGAFSKYVAPAIVDSILKDPSKLSVGGERKELTICFTDIRGFTTFSEKMDPKRLAQFLNDYLGLMTDIVFDHEGTLDKYIGDAVMAFWGAPLDQPKHAANACKAAVRMLQTLAENYERFKTQYDVEVKVGIGVNSGPVNVGNMGSDRIFEYTVIGDHVNLASRLEGLTKYYGVGIVTTRFTLDMIKQAGETPLPNRTLDSVKVKGKKSAVELIQVFHTDMNAEGLKLFEEARELYIRKQWDEAISKFMAASEKLKTGDHNDGPSEMYVDRCKEFKKNPPEADWDGSWEMTSK